MCSALSTFLLGAVSQLGINWTDGRRDWKWLYSFPPPSPRNHPSHRARLPETNFPLIPSEKLPSLQLQRGLHPLPPLVPVRRTR